MNLVSYLLKVENPATRHRRVDPKHWDTLVLTAPTGTFYHTYFWVSLWEQVFPFCTTKFFVSVGDDQSYWCGIPVVGFRKKGLFNWQSLPFGSYGGLIARPDCPESSLLHCFNFCQQSLSSPKTFQIIIVHYHPPAFPMTRFTCHTRQTHLVTFPLPVSETTGQLPGTCPESARKMADRMAHHRLEQPAWQSLWSVRAQRSLKKARTSDLQVVDLASLSQSRSPERTEGEAEGLSAIERCYQLKQLHSQQKNQKPKYPLPFYQTLYKNWQLWQPKDQRWGMRWLVAYYKETLVAYQIHFYFRDQVYFWDSASDPEYHFLRPNHRLFAEIFQWTHSGNYRVLNLGASPPGATGLVELKSSLGGKPYQYHEYQLPTLAGKMVGLARKVFPVPGRRVLK